MLVNIENHESGFRIKTSLEEQTFLLGAYSYASESALLCSLFQNSFPAAEFRNQGEWDYVASAGEEYALKSNDPLSSGKLNKELVTQFKEDVERFIVALNSKSKFRYHQKTALEEFSLPHPEKYPELYRICNRSGGTIELQILWNLLTPDTNDMVSPQQAAILLEKVYTDKQKKQKAAKWLSFFIVIGLSGLLGVLYYYTQVLDNTPLTNRIESLEYNSPSHLKLSSPPHTQYLIGPDILFTNNTQKAVTGYLFIQKPGAYNLKQIDTDTEETEAILWISSGLDKHPYGYPLVHYISNNESIDFSSSYFSDSDHSENHIYILNPQTLSYESIEYRVPWAKEYDPVTIIAIDSNQQWHQIEYDPIDAIAPIPIAAIDELEKLENQYLVSLVDAGSLDPNGYITKSAIDWGDGNTSEYSGLPAEPVFHKYTQSAESRYIEYTVIDNEGNLSTTPYVLRFDPNDIDTYQSQNLLVVDDQYIKLSKFIPLKAESGELMAYLQVHLNTEERKIHCRLNPVFHSPYAFLSDVELLFVDSKFDSELLITDALAFQALPKESLSLSIQFKINGTLVKLNPISLDHELYKELQ